MTDARPSTEARPAEGACAPAAPTRSPHVSSPAGDASVIVPEQLDRLFESLRGRGYETVGPLVRDGAIVYDRLESAADLPVGWTDEQGPAHYRLVRRDDAARFGYVVGPHAWKRFLYPPRLTLFTATHDGKTLGITPSREAPPRYALIGVRPCELAAIGIHDRVLTEGPYVDPHYALRRAGIFVVAVNCAQAGACCFCASMGTGPRADGGFDLALTEIIDGNRHVFLVETGSDAGREVLAELDATPSTAEDRERAHRISTATAASMGREMHTDDVHDLLLGAMGHPRWEHVAARCLACTNCTMVCPTCFCTNVEEHTDLARAEHTRVRTWDSCFTTAFSYIHGGAMRRSTRSRYRQWLTHKLATWIDQFGTMGCVGCGRCITWCPVGIDLTEEVRAIRAQSSAVDDAEGT